MVPDSLPCDEVMLGVNPLALVPFLGDPAGVGSLEYPTCGVDCCETLLLLVLGGAACANLWVCSFTSGLCGTVLRFEGDFRGVDEDAEFLSLLSSP